MADAVLDPFLQAVRPADVSHIRQQLLRWWSVPGEWQLRFALSGRRRLPGWQGEDVQLEAEMSRRWMVEALREAELYWVSPEMTEVISTLSATIPDCLPQPPVETAFVMFAKSVPGTDADTGEEIYTSAAMWRPVELGVIGPCLGIETYAWRDLLAQYAKLNEKEQQTVRQVVPTRLFPTGVSEWPVESETSDFSRLLADDPVQQASILEDRKLLSTFWALCSQRIVVESMHQPDRAMRRAAQREGRPLDDIRIIRLREHSPSTEGAGAAGNWSHRWVVGSHWRNQWYPSSGQHRPKLIEAYVKGPEDKPLKVRETVRALVR